MRSAIIWNSAGDSAQAASLAFVEVSQEAICIVSFLPPA
jgi:hypothetical protein